MSEHEASRTLVKSAPELWAECSDAASLRRHLGSFGEIRITTLDPETAVAWEGEDVRGTVTLEPSGWGTRVTLTAVAETRAAEVQRPVAVPAPAAVPPPVAEQPAVTEAPALAPGGLWARLRARLRLGGRAVAATDSPAPVAADAHPSPAIAEPTSTPPLPAGSATPSLRDELTALNDALDSLGRAHHRPYSRP